MYARSPRSPRTPRMSPMTSLRRNPRRSLRKARRRRAARRTRRRRAARRPRRTTPRARTRFVNWLYIGSHQANRSTVRRQGLRQEREGGQGRRKVREVRVICTILNHPISLRLEPAVSRHVHLALEDHELNVRYDLDQFCIFGDICPTARNNHFTYFMSTPTATFATQKAFT